MQRTDFPFEIIVHDDASTDGTAAIIAEYASKRPDLFVVITQTENQHNLGKTLNDVYNEFILPRAEGEYICFCEGDDYWTDPLKLQKQVETLEKHPECGLCVHKVRTVSEDGTPLDGTYPSVPPKGETVESGEFIDGLADRAFYHTSSFMCRSEMLKNMFSDFVPKLGRVYVADVPLLLYFGSVGKVAYIDDEMSCYRRNSVGSWTESQKAGIDRDIAFKKQIVRLYCDFNAVTDGRFDKACRRQTTLIRAKIAETEHDFAELSKPEYKDYVSVRSISFRARVFLAGMKRSLRGK